MTDKKLSVTLIKAKANSLMKSGKYVEAIMEYSEGISLQPANPLLYSNRSLAFLKLSQYFFALKDAETTIRLVPDWAKGYYRKGQAELEAELFSSAIATFQQGLRMCPEDEILMKELDEARAKMKCFHAWKRRTLRRYAMLGGVIGFLLVVTDMISQPKKPILKAPSARWLFIFSVAALGYMLRSVLVTLVQANKASLLQPPPDSLSSFPNIPLTSLSNTEYSDCAASVASSQAKTE